MTQLAQFAQRRLRASTLRARIACATFLLCLLLLSVLWHMQYMNASHKLELEFDAAGVAELVLYNSNGNYTLGEPLQIPYPDLTQDWELAIEASGRKNPNAWDAQVWVQKILVDGRELDFDSIDADAGWQLVDSVRGTKGKALVSYGEGAARWLRVKAQGHELTVEYSRHEWSGILNIVSNGRTRKIDAWRNGYAPDSITLRASPGPRDKAENCRASFFMRSGEIPRNGKLMAGLEPGLKIRRALFDGKEIDPAEDRLLPLPSRFRLVTLPALGLSLAMTPGLVLILLLIFTFFKRHPFAAFTTLVVGLKLWTIGADEIRASPYDAHGYMQSALNSFWGNPYSAHGYDRQPGYPLLIAAGRSFGLPLRLWMELLHCGAALLLASALPRLHLPRWSSAIALTLLVFSPLSLPAYSFAYQDAAYAPYFMAMLACMMHSLAPGAARQYAFAGTGIFAALVWNTRPEHILVIGLLAIFGAAISLCEWSRQRRLIPALGQGALALAPSLALVTMFTLLFSGLARSSHMGAFAASSFQLPGFTSLYDELLAIEPENPRPYQPAPTDARQKAYAASPSFATLRDALEGPTLDTYRPMAEATGQVKDDFGVFFFWGLRIAPWYGRQWHDAAELDRYYADCAAELKAARLSGAYPSRKVYAHFVEPDASLWLPYLGEGMARYLGILTRRSFEGLPPEPDSVESAIFDSAALRRASLVKNNQALWTSPADPARRWLKNASALAGAAATWLCLPMLLTALALILHRKTRSPLPETMLALSLLTLLSAAFVSRFLLLSLMHAVAFGAESRYILPVAFVPALVCAISAGLIWKRMALLRKGITNTHSANA